MTKPEIQIAIDLYDRHIPLFGDCIQESDRFNFKFMEVGMVPPRRHGVDRHRRMLINKEFDAAEVSLASYLVARDQGMTDLIALPIFPRRLFSQNHIFVSDKSCIRTPCDLVGRRIVVWAFQVTMSVLAKGDLKRDYGVDWREIHWLTQKPEEIDADYGLDVVIEQLPDNFNLLQSLRTGEVDAYINPHPPEELMTPGKGISRLFPNWQQTTREYFDRHSYFPIMHVIAVKTNLLKKYDNLASELLRVFDGARDMIRSYYIDPGFSTVMHARNVIEYEESHYCPQVWASGLNANRRNLDDFMDYCVDQRLFTLRLDLDEVFYPIESTIVST